MITLDLKSHQHDGWDLLMRPYFTIQLLAGPNLSHKIKVRVDKQNIEVVNFNLPTEQEENEILQIKSRCLERMKEILNGHITTERENYLRRLSNLVALPGHERSSHETLSAWLAEDIEFQIRNRKLGDKFNVG